jgi:hypothetical protein
MNGHIHLEHGDSGTVSFGRTFDTPPVVFFLWRIVDPKFSDLWNCESYEINVAVYTDRIVFPVPVSAPNPNDFTHDAYEFSYIVLRPLA